MGHNSWIAKAERIETVQRDETSQELAADARAVVDKWNADIERRKESQFGYADRKRYPQFSPHIGAALRASKPWLRVLCMACQQVGDVDLRTIVRPSDTPVAEIYDALHCLRCRGGTAVEILGLFGFQDDQTAG